MADSNIQPYPLMFDPSQWSNKFSPLQGKPFPFPTSYVGPATDAHGNVIQSYADAQAAHDAWRPPPVAAPAPAPQGTTLNSSPNGQIVSAGAQMGDWSQLAPNAFPNDAVKQKQYAYDLGLGGNVNPSSAIGRSLAAQQQPAAAPAAAPPTNPIDMNAAYMAALAKPGHVTTPGATVPQSPPPSNQSGVLQQFLQNWQNRGSPTQGAGNYNNAGFFNALRGQV